MGVIAQFIDSDDKNYLSQFQSLLPGMIQVIGQCVETSNEAGARQLFDVLETLLILVSLDVFDHFLVAYFAIGSAHSQQEYS